MRLRPSYPLAVPPLYVLAAFVAGQSLQPLPDRVWERVWWPVIIVSIAAVYLPTTAWLARRADPRWMRTTALNAAVSHAVAALLLYGIMMLEAPGPRRYADAGDGMRFEVPRLVPGWGEIVMNGGMTVLAAAALAGLLSLPVGALCRAVAGPLPPRTAPGRRR